MGARPMSGAEVSKALMRKMRAKAADAPTLEDRMDAAVGKDAPAPAQVPTAPAQPKRVRMSGQDLAQMQRQERREKRLKERGY